MTYKHAAALSLVINIIIVLLAGCGSPSNNNMPDGPSTLPPSPTPYQSIVNRVLTLIHKYSVPNHLMQLDAVKTPDDFDVNEYFSVFEHVSMKPGYVLDYVYHYTGMGGEPVLYVKKADQPPYRNYSEYWAAGNNGDDEEQRYGFVNGVLVDDTEIGFFELIVLRTMASQFYQYWHAGYNDARIICDQTGLEALRPLGGELPPDIQKKARDLDFSPVIDISESIVTVKVVIFTNWGGFIQETYVISRSFPHTILKCEKKVLIPYYSGFRF